MCRGVDTYTTKDGITKKKPIHKAHKLRTDPKLDAEFAHFMSYLKNYTKGFPDKKIERYFDTYIERMQKVKEVTIRKNTEYKGETVDE